MTSQNQAPVAKAQMLIRKPAAEVFEALVDPEITRRFWFSRGSARLEAGARVEWSWEMYGFSVRVDVLEIEQDRRILLEWGGPDHPSTIEWRLEPKGDAGTFVRVENRGFTGDPEQVVAQALDSTGGFSFLLAALKAFLEHGIELDVVVDHDPDHLVEGWKEDRDGA